jgi:LPS-assembly protein
MRARRPHFPTLRSLLLAGCGACLLAAGAARAQDATPPAPDDGLDDRALYLDAAEVARIGDRLEASREQGDRLYARFQDHALRTRRLTYDLSTGVATAQGEVELTAPDGATVFADYLELTEGGQTGVAVNFATRLQDGSSLMAATAVRRSETVNELNYAIFTPCPICDENGPKEPTISLQAQRVIQDENLRAVLYRNAVFKVKGVPVLFLPFFAHPDPTVERASGFLVPEIGFDQERGLSWEQPYLIVVSPSEDWLISPQFNTEVEPLLNLQWRRRFADGIVVARGGYTWARNFGDFDVDDDGVDDPPQSAERKHRSYLLAYGAFDRPGPWRWGFTAERTSDKTLFDRYDVRDPYADNGLYHGDERRLITQAYAERQTERSYVSVAAFAIQSLRVVQFIESAPGLNVFERDGALPVVAPIVEARWEPDGPVFGGRLRLTGSAVSLYRDDYVGAPVLRPEVLPVGPAPTEGVDSRRVTGRVEWRRAMISAAGVRWEPFVDGRFDVYSISQLPAPGLEDDQTITRGRFTAGLDVSWPLIRPLSGGADLILEPMGQISASSDADLDSRVPNEDSQVLDLDETSLFRVDRFPGLDLYEGGLRVTGGARATVRWRDGGSAALFVGRSWRSDAEPGLLTAAPDMPSVLYDATGLADQASDWVVQGTFEPHDGIRAWGRASIDDSGDVRRAEAAVEGRWGRRNAGSLIYVMDDSNPVDGPLNRNYAFVESSVQQFVVGDWGVVGRGVYDLDRDLFVRSEVGLLFDDDCVRFEIGYRRDNTRVRPSGASEGAYVRLTLATFGGTR